METRAIPFEYGEKNENQMLISKRGLIRLVAYAAFKHYGRPARKKATVALNVLLSRAKENGYTNEDKVAFFNVFRVLPEDKAATREALMKLDKYVLLEDVNVALQALDAVVTCV